MSFKQIAAGHCVTAQLTAGDVTDAAMQYHTSTIFKRQDGGRPGQLSAVAVMEAEVLGLKFAYPHDEEMADMIHIVPPQVAPDLGSNGPLVAASGFIREHEAAVQATHDPGERIRG